jgi:uncharacterized protein (TIGR01777 family)
MKIAITGSSGLIGQALVDRLNDEGHDVLRLVRRLSSNGSEASWDPDTGQIEPEKLADVDGVVHLAGESIAEGRWNEAKKARIRDSRVPVTKKLCEHLAGMADPPRVLVSASAIGYYGDQWDQVCTETSPPGDTFLAHVCRDWEAATQPAADAGIRVVNTRIGVVLSPKGGALAKMLLPFKLGVGGKVGSGKQFWSWLSLDDLAGILVHALTTDGLRGPVNAVSPNPVTNLEFTKTLGKVLGRPTIFPLPAFVARLALGEMADELLLSSARVVPQKLEVSRYRFKHAILEEALRDLLDRDKKRE